MIFFGGGGKTPTMVPPDGQKPFGKYFLLEFPTNLETIFSIIPFFNALKNGIFFTGFEPRHAAGLAEQPIYFFAIVFWHLNESFVRSALNSKILLLSAPFAYCVFNFLSFFPNSGVYILQNTMARGGNGAGKKN